MSTHVLLLLLLLLLLQVIEQQPSDLKVSDVQHMIKLWDAVYSH